MPLSWILLCSTICLLFEYSHGLPSPLIDLTYDYFNLTPTFLTHTKFESINKKIVKMPSGVRFQTADFTMSEHAGTHMDAPSHFLTSNVSLDGVPIEHFTGPGVVIDITSKASQNPDALVEMADIEAWEKQFGPIPNGSIVLMKSGWGKHWQNRTAYLGSLNISDLHFPGFHGDVCKWLASERSIVGLGVDTVSLDHGPSPTFPCHLHLANAGVYGLENVANVDKLPLTGMTIRAYPMKILGGTGAPTRVIATLNAEGISASKSSTADKNF